MDERRHDFPRPKPKPLFSSNDYHYQRDNPPPSTSPSFNSSSMRDNRYRDHRSSYGSRPFQNSGDYSYSSRYEDSRTAPSGGSGHPNASSWSSSRGNSSMNVAGSGSGAGPRDEYRRSSREEIRGFDRDFGYSRPRPDRDRDYKDRIRERDYRDYMKERDRDFVRREYRRDDYSRDRDRDYPSSSSYSRPSSGSYRYSYSSTTNDYWDNRSRSPRRISNEYSPSVDVRPNSPYRQEYRAPTKTYMRTELKSSSHDREWYRDGHGYNSRPSSTLSTGFKDSSNYAESWVKPSNSLISSTHGRNQNYAEKKNDTASDNEEGNIQEEDEDEGEDDGDEDDDLNQDDVERRIDLIDVEIAKYENILQDLKSQELKDADLENDLNYQLDLLTDNEVYESLDDMDEDEKPLFFKAKDEAKVSVLSTTQVLPNDPQSDAENKQPLFKKIYEENRQKAKKNTGLLGKTQDGRILHKRLGGHLINSNLQNLDVYIVNLLRNNRVRPYIVEHMKDRRWFVRKKKQELVQIYKSTFDSWKIKAEKWEQKLEKIKMKKLRKSGKQSSLVSPLGSSGINANRFFDSPAPPAPTLGAANVPGSRGARRSVFASDAVRSEAEFESILASLSTMEAKPEERNRCAKDVPMILDPYERQQYKALAQSHLIRDPQADLNETETNMMLKWSDAEKNVFLIKLLQFGKNFPKIAESLPNKTTADCVFYYYREKINVGVKQLSKKNVSNLLGARSGKRRGPGRRPVLKEKEGDWEVESSMEESSSRRGMRIVEGGSNRRNKPKGPRKGDESSAEETHQVKDEWKSPPDTPQVAGSSSAVWSDTEKVTALEAFAQYGRDYVAISKLLNETKTPEDVQAFYQKYKKKLRLSEVVMQAESRQKDSSDTKEPSGNWDQGGVDALDNEEEDGEKKGRKKKRKRTAAEEGDGKEDGVPDEDGANESTVTTNRRTVSYWSVAEKAEFIRSLKLYGRNWAKIAETIVSKSAIQSRNYFHNFRVKLEFDRILAESGHSIEDDKVTREEEGESNRENQSSMSVLQNITSPNYDHRPAHPDGSMGYHSVSLPPVPSSDDMSYYRPVYPSSAPYSRNLPYPDYPSHGSEYQQGMASVPYYDYYRTSHSTMPPSSSIPASLPPPSTSYNGPPAQSAPVLPPTTMAFSSHPSSNESNYRYASDSHYKPVTEGYYPPPPSSQPAIPTTSSSGNTYTYYSNVDDSSSVQVEQTVAKPPDGPESLSNSAPGEKIVLPSVKNLLSSVSQRSAVDEQ